MKLIILFKQIKEIFAQKKENIKILNIITNENYVLAIAKLEESLAITEKSLAKIKKINENCDGCEDLINSHYEVISDYLSFSKNSEKFEKYNKKLMELKTKYIYVKTLKNILNLLHTKLTEIFTLIKCHTIIADNINYAFLLELVRKIHNYVLILDVFNAQLNFFDLFYDQENTGIDLHKEFLEDFENEN